MRDSEKTAGQIAADIWYETDDMEAAAAAVIAHVRPQIEEEYRKRYPTGFCDCACKMDEAGDNVLSLCNTHRDYVKEREAEARAAAIADASPPGHVCVPTEAIESIKEDKIFPDSGFSEEYIRGYNEACAEHYDELKDYLPTRPK